MENPVTLRQIIRCIIFSMRDYGCDDWDEDRTISHVKQKLAHVRRVIARRIDDTRDPYDKNIETDQILDIFYEEIDNFIEGNDDLKKDLRNMAKEAADG